MSETFKCSECGGEISIETSHHYVVSIYNGNILGGGGLFCSLQCLKKWIDKRMVVKHSNG